MPHELKPDTVARLRSMTEHLTLVTLGDGRSEDQVRREVFRDVWDNDTEPQTSYLLMIGMTAAFLRALSHVYEIPTERLTALFGEITGAMELPVFTAQEMHPSHPRFHGG